MDRVRVCHMTSAHASTDTRIFYKECTYIAMKEDFEVFLVAKGDSRKENGVNIIGLGNKKLGRIERMIGFSRRVYKAALKIDAQIYHFHDPELLPFAKKLKKKGKIVIFDSHEDTYQQIMIKTYIPKKLRKIAGKIYYWYETKVCREIDCVIFPCPVEGKHPFEGRAKRYIYINNYPIINDEEKRRNKGISLCYVGSLSENRGVTTLLQAYKKIKKDVNLILAGQFESEEYEEYIREEGLLEGVDYRGFCSRHEVNEVYNESAVGISTLHNVGQYPKLWTFPTKVYEYMAKGLAVIVSDYPFSEKVIKENPFGILVDPQNEDCIAKAISELVDDKERIYEMGMLGKKAVDRDYNWERESKKIIQLYVDLIKRRILCNSET